MSKISCHIIQDILPLYVDGIVSEDTKEMVEEHLRECESCRKEAEHMQERIVLPNKKEFYQKEQEMLQKFKRRLINRRVLSAILGAVFVCALLASGYTILMIPKEAIPFDPDKMKVEIVGEDAYLSYQGDDLAVIKRGKERREEPADYSASSSHFSYNSSSSLLLASFSSASS